MPKCSICKKEGHYRSTCPVRVACNQTIHNKVGSFSFDEIESSSCSTSLVRSSSLSCSSSYVDSSVSSSHSSSSYVSTSSFQASSEQQSFVDLLSTKQNIIANCVAGSGKTTTVLHLARSLPHLSFLQITYNARLKDEVRKKVKQSKLSNLTVHGYHSFATTYFDTHAHEQKVFSSIIDNKRNPMTPIPFFDVLVIDECQDMTDELFRFTVHLLNYMTKGFKQVPLFLLLGDQYQTIYQFRKAYSYYLTEAASIWKRPFAFASLQTSYRMTLPMAHFVNDIMLGEERMKAVRDGEKVTYIKCNPHSNALILYLKDEIKKYDPEDIFVLVPSTRKKQKKKDTYTDHDKSNSSEQKGSKPDKNNKPNKSPAHKLENVLVDKYKIPCFFPKDDDEYIKDELMEDKLVFCNHYQSKGRERKLVIVYGFDNSYFKYYAKDTNPLICPEILYVAATRASEKLILIQCADSGPFSFFKTKTFMNGKDPQIHYKELYIPSKKQEKKKSLTESYHSIYVTSLIRQLKHVHLSFIHPLLTKLIVIEKEKHVSVQIKSIIKQYYRKETKQKSLCEDVSTVLGLAIPTIFEKEQTGISTIEQFVHDVFLHQQDMIHITNNDTFSTFYRNLPVDVVQLEDYVKLCLLYISINEEICSTLAQMKTYDILTQDVVDSCTCILREQLDRKTFGNVKYEYSISHTRRFEPYGDITIQGRLDAIRRDSVVEIKVVDTITTEHMLQLILYAWLWKQNNCVFDEPTNKVMIRTDSSSDIHDMGFRIVNCKTGEVLSIVQSDETDDMIDSIVERLIINKYEKDDVLSKEEFLIKCEQDFQSMVS